MQSELCVSFVESIHDYCRYLIKLDKKKSELEENAKKRKIPAPQILKSEQEKLNIKAKRMGDFYGRLIFANRSVGEVDDKIKSAVAFRSAIDFNRQNDIVFYDSLILLYQRVLEQCFDQRKEMPTVSIELARLFKTNVFNEQKRAQNNDQLIKQFPALRDFSDAEIRDIIKNKEVKAYLYPSPFSSNAARQPSAAQK